MQIRIPDLSLVALIGGTSSGKTTLAKKYFKSTEVISSDYCRSILADDESNQSVNKDAFDLLHTIVDKRLNIGNLTVVDATNLEKSARGKLVSIAKKNDCFSVAIVLDLPVNILLKRNEERTDRNINKNVVIRHSKSIKRSVKQLKKEGFRYVYIIKTLEDLESVNIELIKSWNNLKHEHGPFDIIGDIHGCYDELVDLLSKLGYVVKYTEENRYGVKVISPFGRKLIFLGDINDRGPKVVESFKLVMSCVKDEVALCVPGNHEAKLLKKLKGKNVTINYGLEETLNQLENETAEFKNDLIDFIDGLISHYVLDEGKLVVAHAGLPKHYHGRSSGRVRSFSIYGDVTGEIDEHGLPIRNDWTKDYRDNAIVVYGHVPKIDLYKSNNTFGIDTGCVFGGSLTALKYPELEHMSVEAKETYIEHQSFHIKNREENNLIHYEDVIGNKIINTRFFSKIKIQEENSIAAFEAMSRFAINPNWLVYLPPTMSPAETSREEEYLEHPQEAFDYYFSKGVEEVVCEEKHMGSRAIIVLCKDQETAQKRFGSMDGKLGVCYTRTGKRFFDDKETESVILKRVKSILDKTNFWDDFKTDWVVLDNELMPWSAKAQQLLKDSYAPIGLAGRESLEKAKKLISQANSIKESYIVSNIEGTSNTIDIGELFEKTIQRSDKIDRYIKAYKEYCWDVFDIDDYKLAPFHILATEGLVHFDKTNEWHMDTIKKYFDVNDPIIKITNYLKVTNDNESIKEGIKWWLKLTKNGGEGMVVKPNNFIEYGKRGIMQPAVKCRGKEYLRIIYGPEYDFKENLQTLKKRSVKKKRSMALKEFALGIEALERFVNKEPLHKIHECVFGVLAMESEKVDPRL